jgi:hypothetical protein
VIFPVSSSIAEALKPIRIPPNNEATGVKLCMARSALHRQAGFVPFEHPAREVDHILETSVSAEGENRTPVIGILIQTRTNTGRFATRSSSPV